MKRFRKSKTLVWMIIGTVLLSIFLLSTYASRSAGIVVNGLSWVDRFVATPLNMVRETKDNLSALLQTYEENKRLKKEVQPVLDQRAEIASLKEENAELRALLEMKEIDTGSLQIAADVINRSPLSWGDELIINKGKANQITESFLAVSEKGLIGTVAKVEQDASWVRLLTSQKETSPVAVKIKTAKGEIFGILSGYDKEEEAFIVDQLNSSDAIEKDSQVFTSGLGTYTIANIPVGKVLSVGQDSQNLARQLLVKPQADFSKLSALVLLGGK